MNENAKRRLSRNIAIGAAAVIVVCVAVLTIAWTLDRAGREAEDQRIAELQEAITQDASLAPELAAEHARITTARQTRKKLADILSIVLIAAGGIFIGASKWRLSMDPRQPVPLDRLVQVASAPGVPKPARSGTPAPEPGLEFVDEIIAQYGTSREAAIPILQAIQTHYRYLPDEALHRICELTEITPSQIAGTSSFYAQFRRSPVGKHVVRVCHGTACHVAGARQITDELRRRLDIPEGEDTDPDRMFTVDEVACLGCCSLAPVMMVDEHTAGKLTPSSAAAAIEAMEPKEPA